VNLARSLRVSPRAQAVAHDGGRALKAASREEIRQDSEEPVRRFVLGSYVLGLLVIIIMDSYNKNNVKIAGIIVGLSILFGILGYRLTHKYLFMNITAMIVSVTFIWFSPDLTMQRVTKYNLNYGVFHGMYIFIGLTFLLVSFLNLLSPLSMI
jgi:hypothetical protein